MNSIIVAVIMSLSLSLNTRYESNTVKFKVDLVSIQYYSQGNCSEKAPVLVRVVLKTMETELKKLKMVVKYSPDITYTKQIKEIDKNGNIIYSFCTSETDQNEFSITIVKENGEKSNVLLVKTAITKNNISDTKPPLLINVE